MKYKIALGTTSEQKRCYLERELKSLAMKYELSLFEVSSGVSDQPMTDDETRRGSLNRARDAYKSSPGSDFGIGIEVGYHKNSKGYDIFCWVTIFSKEGNTYSHKSGHITLPKFHAAILKEGKRLGDHVQIYIDNAETEEDKTIGTIIKTREPFIREAIRKSLEDYLLEVRN